VLFKTQVIVIITLAYSGPIPQSILQVKDAAKALKKEMVGKAKDFAQEQLNKAMQAGADKLAKSLSTGALPKLPGRRKK
jgi:hypothetical protein